MKTIRNYMLMAAFTMFGFVIAGCSSNSKTSNQGSGEEFADGEQTETNAPSSFTSKQDVLDYVLDCWWTCDKFKLFISKDAGLKFMRADYDSPSVSDLNYIEVRRFEGGEAIIEYSYDNIAAGRQTIRSEVSLTDGTLKYGTNTLHKEGDVRFEQKGSVIEATVESVTEEAYDE